MDAISQGKESSPGPDDITLGMISHLPEDYLNFFLKFLNKMWNIGTLPLLWKTAIIIMIPKPNKDHTLTENYRPISLTCVPCKILERIINNRLMWKLERNNFFNQAQCGYRKNASTLDSLLQLEQYITASLNENKATTTVFFDLKKAYDTTWRRGILEQLKSIGLHGQIIALIQNFLLDRKFRIKADSTISQFHSQQEGLPQGSVLSCTLFLIAINPIFTDLPRNILTTMYVDDIAISYSSNRTPNMERTLRTTINKLNSNASMLGYTFASAKTKAVTFQPSRKKTDPPTLTLENLLIQNVKEYKYLGVILDRKLNWTKHLTYLKEKSNRRINLMKKISSQHWGANIASLLMLHRTLVLPTINYGCELFSSAPKGTLAMLDPIHHRAIRIAVGGYITSPINSLLADSGNLPLKSYRAATNLKTYFRLRTTPNSTTAIMMSNQTDRYTLPPAKYTNFAIRSLEALEEIGLQKYDPFPMERNATPPWQLKDPPTCYNYLMEPKTETPTTALKTFFLGHLHQAHKNDFIIYTDGSKSEAGTGFGLAFPNDHLKETLPPIATNFTAEATAVLRALRRALTFHHSNITIITDSKSVIQALLQYKTPHHLLDRAKLWLDLLQRRGKNITICWCPAHCGIQGNERADALAKEAAESTFIHPQDRKSTVPYQDIKLHIDRIITQQWKQTWQSQLSNKLRIIKEDIEQSPQPHKPTRTWETKLTRLRIGHTALTHSHLLTGDPAPVCDQCLVLKSVYHIIIECYKYDHLRETHLGLPEQITLRTLLMKTPQKVLLYLKATNLFNKL